MNNQQLHNRGRVLRRMLVAVIAVSTLATAPARGQQADGTRADFQLPAEKADAMFSLLAPNDIKVMVGRSGNGIYIRGNDAEVEAVRDFVGLITRYEGKGGASKITEEMIASWKTEKTFKLPAEKARLLFAVLAFDDVPVLVGPAESGVQVTGEPKDVRTVNRIVTILHGKRLGKGDDKSDDVEVKEHKGSKEPKGQNEGKADDESLGGEVSGTVQEFFKQFKEQSEKLHRQVKQDGQKASEQIEQLKKEAQELNERVQALQKQLAESTEKLAKDAQVVAEKAEAAAKKLLSDKGVEAKAEKAEKASKKADDAGDAELEMRTYELPEHHAKNLYKLLAPNDVRSVIVERSGGTVRIQATPKDHETFEQLVKLLTRKD